MKKIYYFTGGYTEPAKMGSGETVPGRCKGITCYEFEQETGELRELAVTPGIANPSYILADPSAPYLYCVNELKEYGGIHGSTVSACRICPETGELQLLNRQFTCGADACHLSFSPDRAYLLAANYSGSSFCVFPVSADHTLGQAACVLRHKGKGADLTRQQEPHPHQTLLSPDGRYVYVSDLGLDRLACYRADWDRGWLLPEEGRDICGIAGQGVRHAVFNGNGTRLYVMTEMACEVNVYSYETGTGKTELMQRISALPSVYGDVCLGAAIRIHPTGKWLYVSVRGTDQLAVFEIDGEGTLSLIQMLSSGGEIPRDFVLSPNGKYLLAANQDTENICIFSVCPQSGQLKPAGTRERAGGITVLAPWEGETV